MANFNPRFAASADERRFPTAQERAGGFDCGPADLGLFNGMFNRLESEVGHVIDHAGIVPTDDRMTQLREAIEILIDAAVGSGDVNDFVSLSQLKSRLLFYPQVQSNGGILPVTSPSVGTIRVPGGYTILHRSINPVVTVQEDLLTAPSKTYHLRWNETDGFTLKDLVSGGAYNPGTLTDGDQSFDTTYDDMLVSRIVTNSGNVATITNLINLHHINTNTILMAQNVNFNGGNSAYFEATSTFNWARKPTSYHISLIGAEMTNNAADHDYNFRELGIDTSQLFSGNLGDGLGGKLSKIDLNRYSFGTTILKDWATNVAVMFTASC